MHALPLREGGREFCAIRYVCFRQSPKLADRHDWAEHRRIRKQAEATRTALLALRGALRRALPELTPPSPFYAVLLMDGDSLGKHMSEPSKQGLISAALNAFTGVVANIVSENNGFLIYAGGDDVLAVLPLEEAMDCALHLRHAYLQAFAEQREKAYRDSPELEATLSGAIEYAHIKMPLTKVLRDAHGLLDGVAKDARGRDALAVRVWKPGGKALE